MRKGFNDAAAWLRKRWLLLSFVALVTVALVVAALTVLRLPEYPAHQAASLRRSIEIASRAGLPMKERLALEKDLLQYETDNRVKIWTTIVQAIGGTALLIGLLFTWRNLRATQFKLDIDREGQLTNRFTQATTQLGAQLSDGRPNVEARLGGIYALSWIARDSPDNYWPVMEILTAYVRHNAAWPPSGQVIHSLPGAPHQPKPRTDIQAILTVLGRSKPPEAKGLRLDQKFDLRFTDLRGAEFWDAHLEKTDFWGAHLEGAKLWGACLDNTKLVKRIWKERTSGGSNLQGRTSLTPVWMSRNSRTRTSDTQRVSAKCKSRALCKGEEGRCSLRTWIHGSRYRCNAGRPPGLIIQKESGRQLGSSFPTRTGTLRLLSPKNTLERDAHYVRALTAKLRRLERRWESNCGVGRSDTS